MEANLFLALTFIAVLLLFLLFYYILSQQWSQLTGTNTKRDRAVSVLMVIGSGGHTREILTLAKALDNNYSPRYYIIAETDSLSKAKVEAFEKERLKENKDLASKYEIFFIPRSREVKQSYTSSVLTTLRALFFSVPLVLRLKPDLILCNGPGTCIPVCLLGLLLKWMRLHRTKVVYVESLCRVTSLSLSGKILYPLADAFFIQWPELLKLYPKSRYLGRLV